MLHHGPDAATPHLELPMRLQLQCELDAAFFHLYSVSRGDAEYILGTFDVLEHYDARAKAATGQPYVSPLGRLKRAEPRK